jgi:RimJ/RimL family protein N-acetyltransferase
VLLPAATERLWFRTWDEADLELASALFGDSRVTEFVGGPFDAASVAARLDAEIAMHRDHGIQYWPVFTHDRVHVGCCGLKPRSERVHEFGFYLRPEHWGQGFANEAGRSVIAFAFRELAAEALCAGHHPNNTASQRALAKLGFSYVHDEHYPPTGLWHRYYTLRP